MSRRDGDGISLARYNSGTTDSGKWDLATADVTINSEMVDEKQIVDK